MKIMLLTLLFLIMPGSGHGQCSRTSATTTFAKNKRNLLDLLIKNTPLHDGFYNSSVGSNSDQVYGVAQCKANISTNVCANCLNSSITLVDGCSESPEIESIHSLCITKITNKNIFGVWTNSSTATYGNQGLEDPLVFSKGFAMMEDLASNAPYQPLMYQAAVIDVGVDGKRYGLAQCGRYLSRLNCRSCLEDRLQGFRSYVENRTGWEILGSSCSMWYSNVSDTYKTLNVSVVEIAPLTMPSDGQVPPGTTSVTSGAKRCHGRIVTETKIWISTFTILFLATQGFHFS
ncbi:putative Gnk2-like domain-containing protein [Helianthus annuus]|uniref:Gnk2-like domain-containing protein n=1 Tax=Helianthus annuus TaxID=4232 RepID=A0A251VKK4_HELAN|nr:putative Gnk2-like domain-containing protein [Helianthus annuus]